MAVSEVARASSAYSVVGGKSLANEGHVARSSSCRTNPCCVSGHISWNLERMKVDEYEKDDESHRLCSFGCIRAS
jgi:hypothetical protein